MGRFHVYFTFKWIMAVNAILCKPMQCFMQGYVMLWLMQHHPVVFDMHSMCFGHIYANLNNTVY